MLGRRWADKPLVMAVFGAVLIATVKALRMTTVPCPVRAAALAFVLGPAAAVAAGADAKGEPEATFALTGFYYAMRDQPDFTVGVATLKRGSLHLEARYNYEARDAGSAFVGWKFAGGDTVSFEVTPIIGALFGAARGMVPGVEASVASGTLGAYVEAEYVYDLDQHSGYYYMREELGWKPRRSGYASALSATTREIENGRDLQRGFFAQLFSTKATLGIYAQSRTGPLRHCLARSPVQRFAILGLPNTGDGRGSVLCHRTAARGVATAFIEGSPHRRGCRTYSRRRQRTLSNIFS